MAEARSQMDFLGVHNSYDEIKADSINRFLANEQVNLKNHINERANNLLETISQIETQNQKSVIRKIVNEAITAVDQTLEDNQELIKEKIFESAILGIRNKGMTYENDPIMPLVKETIA